jgi:hypothetical protein
MNYELCDFSDLKGEIIRKIKVKRNKNKIFFITDTKKYKMYHEQDCCEDVYIEDICGFLDDLINAEILQAKEEYFEGDDKEGSSTYSFYKLRTQKGSVTIRWYGSSNGYYSESAGLYYKNI